MSFPDSDPRILTLKHWLQQQLKLEIHSLEAASSDASFRRYFRVIHTGGCQIVMDAPPDKENTEPFIRIAQLFATAELHVPVIYAINQEQGFLLLEDLGSQCLLDQLNQTNVDSRYQAALNSLFKLQTRINSLESGLAAYDQALLSRELGIFNDWFVEKQLGLRLPIEVQSSLYELLINSALEQPQVVVHRDFHSRNLMLLDNDSPGIIDFQDAVVGPICYDLVSLLRDCYVSWPAAQVENWLYNYYLRLIDAQLVTVDFNIFKRWFDLIGLQRHLKAVGIFSRLHWRDNKSGYLADIPRTLDYIAAIAGSYPALSLFNDFLHQQLLPAYQTNL